MTEIILLVVYLMAAAGFLVGRLAAGVPAVPAIVAAVIWPFTIAALAGRELGD